MTEQDAAGVARVAPLSVAELKTLQDVYVTQGMLGLRQARQPPEETVRELLFLRKLLPHITERDRAFVRNTVNVPTIFSLSAMALTAFFTLSRRRIPSLSPLLRFGLPVVAHYVAYRVSAYGMYRSLSSIDTPMSLHLRAIHKDADDPKTNELSDLYVSQTEVDEAVAALKIPSGKKVDLVEAIRLVQGRKQDAAARPDAATQPDGADERKPADDHKLHPIHRGISYDELRRRQQAELRRGAAGEGGGSDDFGDAATADDPFAEGRPSAASAAADAMAAHAAERHKGKRTWDELRKEVRETGGDEHSGGRSA